MLTIGSDPEFAIVNEHGMILCAKEFFFGEFPCDDCYEDCDGCDYANNAYRSSIGVDGGDILGELRPRYSEDPLKHHATIAELIHSIELPRGHKLVAGTHQGYESIGGHIHFGYKKAIDRVSFANYLSYYCGIPLRRIECRGDLEYRGLQQFGYGSFGSYKGTDYGMEFRMPASWLVTSKIAKAALCLARVVGSEYIENDNGINIDLSDRAYRALLDAPHINGIIDDIKTMVEYPKYSEYIAPLFEMIEGNRVWFTGDNLKNRW